MTNLPALEVPGEDFRLLIDRALDGLRAVITELGDERLHQRLTPTGHSAFDLVTRAIGVAGVDRDAGSTTAGLLAALDAAQTQFQTSLDAPNSDAPLPAPTSGSVLLHRYEELTRNLGQLEGLRDALLAAAPPVPAFEPLPVAAFETQRVPAFKPPPATAFETQPVPAFELPPVPASEPPPVPAFEPPLAWLRAKQGRKWRRPGPDLLPAWVADMDFPVAPVVRQSVLEVLDRGDLGYPDWPFDRHPLAEVFAARSQRRFGWQPDPAHVRGITDLLAGLQILLDLTTEPGDGVIMQEPNYPPFRATVPAMRREAIGLPVVLDGDAWRHDFSSLESVLADRRAKVLLVLNPHNPTGTAFGTEELHRLADLALRHDLLVISDEIHADLVHEPNRHIPFAGISPEIAARTITLTSATKAFNIAGLRTAVAHIGPESVRELWDAEPPDIHGVANVLGVEATRAAWELGDDWLAGVRAHLRSQRDRLGEAVAQMPGVSLRVPDATYLAWLDCSGADLGEDAGHFFRREARVRTSPGPDYGGGPEWTRLNFATSTAVLDQITGQMRESLYRVRK